VTLANRTLRIKTVDPASEQAFSRLGSDPPRSKKVPEDAARRPLTLCALAPSHPDRLPKIDLLEGRVSRGRAPSFFFSCFQQTSFSQVAPPPTTTGL